MKGTYEILYVKKKQLAEAQYKVCKTEINCQNQLKKLQDQLDSCKKELKEERSQDKQLEVSLSQHQIDLGKRFEEIRELKGQAHKNFEDTKMINQEVTYWERHNRHLQVLLDQKDSFL